MKNKLMTYAAALPVALLLQTTASLAQSASENAPENYYWGHGMMWDGGNWGGFGFFLGPLFMILVPIALIVGVLYLVRAFSAPARPAPSDPANTALAILNERFARGEIELDEFEERRKELLH